MSHTTQGLSMANVSFQWTGQSWQEHINTVLSVHCHLNGETYHSVADKVDGDGGLEGFTSNGHAYQCFCDEDSVNTADRATKQKRKVTRDLKKLTTNANFWAEILQDIHLVSWTLVVPDNEDKAVLTHTRRKAAALRKTSLPFLASNFYGHVCTDRTGFPLAYRRLIECGLTKVHIPPGEVGQTHVDAFSVKRPDFIRNLDTKVTKLLFNTSEDNILTFRKELLDRYLRGSNILQSLQTDAPSLYEHILFILDEQARSITLESYFDSTLPGTRLKDTRTALETTLRSIAATLHDSTLIALSWSAVTELMGECFLDFPVPTHA
jgi:hypothetical protein